MIFCKTGGSSDETIIDDTYYKFLHCEKNNLATLEWPKSYYNQLGRWRGHGHWGEIKTT